MYHLIKTWLCCTAILLLPVAGHSQSMDKQIRVRNLAPHKLSVVLSPTQSSFMVNESIYYNVEGNRDFYLYLFSIDKISNNATLIFPNKLQQDNYFKAGLADIIPGNAVEFFSDRAGEEKLVAIASTEYIDWDTEGYRSVGHFLQTDGRRFTQQSKAFRVSSRAPQPQPIAPDLLTLQGPRTVVAATSAGRFPVAIVGPAPQSQTVVLSAAAQKPMRFIETMPAQSAQTEVAPDEAQLPQLLTATIQRPQTVSQIKPVQPPEVTNPLPLPEKNSGYATNDDVQIQDLFTLITPADQSAHRPIQQQPSHLQGAEIMAADTPDAGPVVFSATDKKHYKNGQLIDILAGANRAGSLHIYTAEPNGKLVFLSAQNIDGKGFAKLSTAASPPFGMHSLVVVYSATDAPLPPDLSMYFSKDAFADQAKCSAVVELTETIAYAVSQFSISE